MRNYVFIKNRQAQDLIEDILDKQTTSTVEVSKNNIIQTRIFNSIF